MAADAVLYLRKNVEKMPLWVFFKDIRNVFCKDELNLEIATIAVPAALALAADPIASLIDTAFIGHIGPVELAAVGVAIAIFNQVSKIAIFPLVSITTSFVAEEDALSLGAASQEIEIMEKSSWVDDETEELISKTEYMAKVRHERRHIPSASSALVIGGMLGIIQTLLLIFTAKSILNFMGINNDSAMLKPARQYLILRSLGAPAVLLSLAMQGVFRGFKDTKTPLYATSEKFLQVLQFYYRCDEKSGGRLDEYHFGSNTNLCVQYGCSWCCHFPCYFPDEYRYSISLILLWKLNENVDLLPPTIKDLQFGRFLKNGFLLLLRVIAATFCVTLAASLAARLGATSMAAFQVCLQVWLAASLLADGLAVAGQAILASAFARNDYEKATATASRVLQMGLVLGLVLAVVVAVGLKFSSGLFSKDINVLRLLSLGIPFVAVTQPINSLAFVFDGVNYGASDFAYSAYSMILVALVSILCLFSLSLSYGYVGIWVALSIFMSLRALAGFWRIGTGTGPWSFLRD